jgi:DNA primase
MMRDGLISHPDKVLFGERGETKRDLAAHYLRVAGPLMRTMGGRPVLLQRFPDGGTGPSFFQKRVPENAPHKTVFGAWSVRARPGAQVSTPVGWDEIGNIHPDQFTVASLAARLDTVDDPWLGMNDDPQSLEPLLEMSARDLAGGLMDAPWPPVYPKQPGEPPRVAPSRAKKPSPS